MHKASMTSFTPAELHRLMHYLYDNDRQLHTLMLLSLGHGLRISEALGLTAENFVDGRIVFGRLKGSQSSNHKLIDHADPAFNELFAVQDVLQVRSDGRVLFDICGRTVNRRLVRACAAVGIHRTKAHHHSAKHTTCTLLLPVLGVDGLQKYVGHTEAKNTLAYCRPSDAQVEERLDGALMWGSK